MREALFNVLSPRISGMVFADLYAGTGAIGIEALSRGASRAIFVEQSREAVRVIHENLDALGLAARAQVRLGQVRGALSKIEAEIVFIDPPYALEMEYGRALEVLGESRSRLVVVQHDARLKLEEVYGTLRRVRVLKQGDNCLSFYEGPNYG